MLHRAPEHSTGILQLAIDPPHVSTCLYRASTSLRTPPLSSFKGMDRNSALVQVSQQAAALAAEAAAGVGSRLMAIKFLEELVLVCSPDGWPTQMLVSPAQVPCPADSTSHWLCLWLWLWALALAPPLGPNACLGCSACAKPQARTELQSMLARNESCCAQSGECLLSQQASHRPQGQLIQAECLAASMQPWMPRLHQIRHVCLHSLCTHHHHRQPQRGILHRHEPAKKDQQHADPPPWAAHQLQP